MSISSSMQVTGLDVFDSMKPSNLQEPFVYFAKLREENPAYWNEQAGDHSLVRGSVSESSVRCRQTLRRDGQARSGHIFNISAIGGLVGYPNLSLYNSTKFAIEGFSESLAHEVSAFGIKVTIVEPGFVRTDFLDVSSIRHGSKSIPGYEESAAQAKQFATANNHQQTGDPDKLAVAIVRLANEANPPLRFLAGSDAFGLATEKLNAMNDEFKRWRELTISTDGNF
jgi:NAD(P)-dependent dehydrogenase (short-subunit alcohol dehydrogenase family)